MSVIPNAFLKAVVPIGEKNLDGSFFWFGTGFIVGKQINGGSGLCPFLITNRHVLENRKAVFIRLISNIDGTIHPFKVDLENSGKISYTFSNEKNIDIAVVRLNAHYLQTAIKDFGIINIDTEACTSIQFLDEGGDVGNNVIMLGYPMGLISENSVIPICRKGCVARFDPVEIKLSKNFILDIQNFPGNSGSPIFICPSFTHLKGTKNITKSYLLGIIHSYFPYKESLISSQTKEVVEIRTENSGLALANPIECIKELIDLDISKDSK